MGAIKYFGSGMVSKLKEFFLVENSLGVAYKDIAYSESLDLLVAVGHSGASYSTDGQIWIKASVPAYNWQGITWSPELEIFCAVASSGTQRVMTSIDGIIWTLGNATINGNWREIVWSPSLGIFCACRYGSSTSHNFMTSPDGITWTPQAVGPSYSANSIAWSEPLGLFISVVSNGLIRTVTSPNGIDWTDRTTPTSTHQQIKVFAHPVDPLVIIARQSGYISARTSYSFDALSWNFMSVSGGSHEAWVYHPVLRQLLSARNSSGDQGRLLVSKNGVNYVESVPQILNSARSGIYFPPNNRVVFVGDDGIIANNL